MAIGCATRDRTVSFASTFAAFLSRAYDQIRMAAISQSNVNLVGSHCGVSIGKTNLFTYKTCIFIRTPCFIHFLYAFRLTFVIICVYVLKVKCLLLR